jgi:hypothetical protein
MALSTSVNWISNFVIAFITPPLFAVAGGGYYFLLLGFCLISGIFVCLVYRETAGKTLEELGEVFGDVEFLVERQKSGVGPPFAEGGSITGTRLVAEPAELLSHDGVDSTKTESTLFSFQDRITKQAEPSGQNSNSNLEGAPSRVEDGSCKEGCASMEPLQKNLERSDSIEEIDLS